MPVTPGINDSNLKSFNYDTSKVFIFDNLYAEGTFLNNTGAQATFPIGTLLGRNSATGELSPLDSTVTTNALDRVVGVLAVELVDIADAATAEITYGHKGDVDENLLAFQGADDLDTPVGPAGQQVTIADDMRRVGLNPVPSDELSKFDNE